MSRIPGPEYVKTVPFRDIGGRKYSLTCVTTTMRITADIAKIPLAESAAIPPQNRSLRPAGSNTGERNGRGVHIHVPIMQGIMKTMT